MSEAGFEAGIAASCVCCSRRDPVRRRGLAAMVEEAGHTSSRTRPTWCCATWRAMPTPRRGGGAGHRVDHRCGGEQPAGVLPREVTAARLDPALRAVAAGLLVRAPGASPDGFVPAVTKRPAADTARDGDFDADRPGHEQQGGGAAARHLRSHGEIPPRSAVRQAGGDQPGRGGGEGATRRRNRAVMPATPAQCGSSSAPPAPHSVPQSAPGPRASRFPASRGSPAPPAPPRPVNARAAASTPATRQDRAAPR